MTAGNLAVSAGDIDVSIGAPRYVVIDEEPAALVLDESYLFSASVTDWAGNPIVAAAVSDPARYVQEFQYRTAAAAEGGAGGGQELRLWTRFDSRAVDGLLREAALPTWGRVRPSLLVWLAVEDAAGRTLVGADDDRELVASLGRGAGQRGVPLVIQVTKTSGLPIVSSSAL